MAKVTSRQVAQAAGVSQTTVSCVLSGNNKIKISEQTRERVIAEALRLGYIKARDPRAIRRPYVAILAPNLTNEYYPKILTLLQQNLDRHGYPSIIFDIERDYKREKFFFQSVLSEQICAVICTYPPDLELYKQYVYERIPGIVVSEMEQTNWLDTISFDSFEAGAMLTNHLLKFGHKNIAYITTPFSRLSYARNQRLRGVTHAMNEAGLGHRLTVCVAPEEEESDSMTQVFEMDCGYRLAKELFSARHDITGVVAVNDLTALGVMKALRELRLSIPGDVSVCGVDNTSLSMLHDPPLTTIDSALSARCRQTVDILADRIKGSEDVRGIVYSFSHSPILVARQSTGPVSARN